MAYILYARRYIENTKRCRTTCQCIHIKVYEMICISSLTNENFCYYLRTYKYRIKWVFSQFSPFMFVVCRLTCVTVFPQVPWRCNTSCTCEWNYYYYRDDENKSRCVCVLSTFRRIFSFPLSMRWIVILSSVCRSTNRLLSGRPSHRSCSV